MYPPINSILILTADMTSILSMILATRVSEYSVIRKSESVSWRFGFAAFCWLAVSWSTCFCRLSISSLACFNFSSRNDASHAVSVGKVPRFCHCQKISLNFIPFLSSKVQDSESTSTRVTANLNSCSSKSASGFR